MTARPVPAIATERTDLISLDEPLLDALATSEFATAATMAGFAIPALTTGGYLRSFGRRRDDLRAHPGWQPWLLRAVVLRDTRLMIGRIGFHGPPEDGVLELGYEILERHRRRGFAREAIGAMMAWALREHAIARFRLSIGEHNAPSLALAASLGFVRTGEQMDPEDGRELIFERTIA